MGIEGKSFWRESHQTVFQHRAEMRSAERDLLKKTDRQKGHDCPKEGCSPGPASNQQRPAKDRRMPQCNCRQSVKENEGIPKEGKIRPGRYGTHAMSYKEHTGPKQHDKLRGNNDREGTDGQND